MSSYGTWVKLPRNIHTRIHTRKYTLIHATTHIYTHLHTHTYTYTHTNTHMIYYTRLYIHGNSIYSQSITLIMDTVYYNRKLMIVYKCVFTRVSYAI